MTDEKVARPRRWRHRAFALALAGALHGCTQEAPADKEQAISQEDRAYGAEQHRQLLAEFGGAYEGGQGAYLRAVGERIAAGAGLGEQCTFTLVNSDVVNAFAVPGCFIYVTRGLLAVIGNEAELASVLGHEVGHIAARHAQRQERGSLWRTLGVIAVSLTGSERLTEFAGRAAQYFGLRYSRTQEYEADDLAVAYLRKAGYDLYAAAEMLEALHRQEAFMNATRNQDAARSLPEWTSSHPLTQKRIARAHDKARASGLKDDALPEKAEAYLEQVDGLLFGDDPQQGFVLGRRFAHPAMRISFEAPTGFLLANSPQAVRLIGPEGVSGEFGGGRLPSGGLRNYAQAVADAVRGDAPAVVRKETTTQINGMPALVLEMAVRVQDGTLPLLIAAYDGGGGEAYHFIMMSPPSNPQAAALEALIRSFRRLSPAQAAALRPRYLQTLVARREDTVDDFVRRTADPSPRALFVLLNPDYEGRAPKSGDRVKIVTYQPKSLARERGASSHLASF